MYAQNCDFRPTNIHMKYWFFIMILLTVSKLAEAQEIDMVTNWNKASELAKNQNKKILIILTGSDWCTPCKKMDRRVINNSEFQGYVHENLIVYLVDITKEVLLDRDNPTNDNYELLNEKYQTDALPALILTDYEDNKIKLVEGKTYDLKNVMKQLRDS